jgi:uncharacterized protein (DUF58 family)
MDAPIEKTRRVLSKDVSSILIGTPALVIWLAGGLVTLALGKLSLCSFFLILLAVGILARLWSHSALFRVEPELHAASASIFAGDRVELSCSITNRKLLPLIWLGYIQYLPRNGCMEPLDPQEISQAPVPAKEADALLDAYRLAVQQEKEHPSEPPVEIPRPTLTRPAYTRRFAFVLWNQTLEWKTTWQAVHRGVYPITQVLLQSGDGFGLSQVESLAPIPEQPTYVVYPKVVPVKTAFFMTNLWQAQQGKAGHVEDCTITRSERDYQNGDPWKRIDWRVAARGGGLQVKLYETIQPRTVHFLLDAASFLDSGDRDALEEAISVVSSLILQLDAGGILCGLSLPETDLQPEAHMFPGPQSTRQMLLFALARFDWAEQVQPFSRDALAGNRDQMGQGYFVTYRAQTHDTLSLLESLGNFGLTLLPWVREPIHNISDLRVCCLQDLKGADSNG